MKNKNLNMLATVIDVTSGLLFVSSFFVKDNEKAVRRRWIALGLIGAGFAVRFSNADFSKSTKLAK